MPSCCPNGTILLRFKCMKEVIRHKKLKAHVFFKFLQKEFLFMDLMVLWYFIVDLFLIFKPASELLE